jgi:hypothetical protein
MANLTRLFDRVEGLKSQAADMFADYENNYDFSVLDAQLAELRDEAETVREVAADVDAAIEKL